MVVRNDGNQAATGVTLADDLDPNSTLVVGSVQTSQGTITEGNSGTVNDVRASIGTLPGGCASDPTIASWSIRRSPLASDGRQPGDHQRRQRRFDHHRRPIDERSRRPHPHAGGRQPILESIKIDSVLQDADANGQPRQGTRCCTPIHPNDGNAAATGIVLADTLDPNTTLVVGSVRTSQGTVTVGNSAGNTAVGVNIGALAGSDAPPCPIRPPSTCRCRRV